MAEVCIEIATEQPKILTADAVKASDVVIIASTGIHAVIRKCDLWIAIPRKATPPLPQFRPATRIRRIGRTRTMASA